VISIPSADIVDWLLVEFRDASDAVSAIPSTIVKKQAVFIKNDGSLVGLDGSTFPIFNATITQKLFVVLWHRNHLGIMSASPLNETGSIYTYDFASSSTHAYGIAAQKNLGGGIYGIYAGDADANGIIESSDKTIFWLNEAGEADYLNSDFNLDGQIDNPDKNDSWLDNLGKECLVPD
jgi:hypothetical protein